MEETDNFKKSKIYIIAHGDKGCRNKAQKRGKGDEGGSSQFQRRWPRKKSLRGELLSKDMKTVADIWRGTSQTEGTENAKVLGHKWSQKDEASAVGPERTRPEMRREKDVGDS